MAEWHIPAPAFLPHDLMLDADGSIRMEPKERYQGIALEANRWRARLADGPQAVAYEELFDFAVRCLNLNYRLPRELVSHLRLVDTDNIKGVMLAAVTGGECDGGE